MPAEERRKNDEDIALIKRILFGEQINGNKVPGMFEKFELVWKQFIFYARVYKVFMIFIPAIILLLIGILIKLFIGGN